MKRIAIIGAGIAGLTLASRLEAVAETEIFEKSRGVGGRMATRYAEPYQFDHGAQFFSVRSRRFAEFLQPFIESGQVARWDAEFVEIDDYRVQRRSTWAEGPAHYVATPTMSALAKQMASGLVLRREIQVSRIEAVAESWELFDQLNNSLGHFDWVVSAIPAAQSLALLPQTFAGLAAIRHKQMLGCYSLMLGYRQALPLPWQAAYVANADISWVSNDSSKPGRPAHYSLLVHSSNRWAEANMQTHPETVTALLMQELARVVDCDVSPADHVSLHRWRFANIARQEGDRFYLDPELQLAAIGDWCIHGRIEAAFLSAQELAEALKSRL